MRDIIVNLLVRTAGFFGLPVLHFCGTVAGYLLYFIPNPYRSVSAANIRTCFPGLGHRAQKKLIRASLVELCKWLFELGPVCRWPPDRLERLVVGGDGFDAVRKTLEQGRGAMLIAPHYGNWELAALISARRFPVTIMYKPPKIGALHRHMRCARSRAGATLVKTDYSGLKALIGALRRGEAIGLLTDQEPKRGAYVYAPFFGQPARTMTLFSKLLRKTRPAVFMSGIRRLPRGRGFELSCIRLDEQLLSDHDEQKAASYMNHAIEKLILEDPAQYLWAYKRFKFPPDLESRGSYNIVENRQEIS